MRFEIFDPRSVPEAQAKNESIFALGPMWGIEVTVPALAGRCVKNIDPQHTGGNVNLAAIEAAIVEEIPLEDAVLATVRADLDSVGAMAILSLRAQEQDLSPAMPRIELVATSDKFARGNWHPVHLPTKENPWPQGGEAASDVSELAAIAASVADFKIPLSQRVAWMEHWLLTGEEPVNYRGQVETERLDLIEALETGQIRTELMLGGKVAVVETTHRAATMVGYAMAPVVVALNPAFKLGGGEPHLKFTVCQFQAGYVDLKQVFAELSQQEPGWGGSPTIGGSPQGVSSVLTMEEVVSVVGKHLLK